MAKKTTYKFTGINSPGKDFNNEIYAKTKKYQKIYGFEIGSGNKDTWNNEADAFKHTFMQARLTVQYNNALAKAAGNIHEIDGNIRNGQTKGEENMDLWNNDIGRQIGKEIRQEMNNQRTIYAKDEIDDKIAAKVMQRMRNGDLITHLDDPRKYKTPTEKFNDEIREKWRSLQQNRNARIQNRTNNSKKNSASGTTDGKWITINGNHVLIDK